MSLFGFRITREKSPTIAGTRTADQLYRQLQVFFIAALIAAAVVEVLGASASTTWEMAFRFLLLNLMLGGAAGFTGGLLGFIFGVPRELTDAAQAETVGGERRSSRPNTNLEQISDWLTKVLVGASLTTLALIPGFLGHLTTFLNDHGYRGLPGEATLAVFVIIYFGALGFFWGYIEARTSITRIFSSIAQLLDPAAVQAIRGAPAEPGSDPIPDDAAILKLDMNQLNTVSLLEARGGAETRARNWARAIDAYRRALELDPGNTRILGKLGLVLPPAGKMQDADQVIREAQQVAQRAGNSTTQNQLEVNKVAAALYKENGYEEASRIGEALLATDQASNAWLHLYLACAYGQRATALKKAGKPFDQERKLALERLADMKRLNPGLTRVALSLWRPTQYGGSPREDDLVVFSDDPDFEKLLMS